MMNIQIRFDYQQHPYLYLLHQRKQNMLQMLHFSKKEKKTKKYLFESQHDNQFSFLSLT